MAFRHILFDLDNTLYPQSCGLMQAIGGRMNLFMVERLGMSPGEVSEKRDHFLRVFGTTLNALRRYYGVDPDEFLDFVHDVPLGDYLRHDHALDQMLENLEAAKVVFTNADARHARRVLCRLGITRHFDSIIDIHLLEFINKPDVRAYQKALEFISARAEECLFVEDSPTNIVPAGKLGMTTVMVGAGTKHGGAHHRIDRITDLGKLIQGA